MAVIDVYRLGVKHEVLLDDEDLELLYNGLSISKTGYVAHNGGRPQYLHRLVMCAPKGTEVDHINGNKLDNRKENLRLCSRSQNLVNSRPRAASRLKGVYRHHAGRWFARLSTSKTTHIHLGMFDCPLVAHASYRQAAKERHGSFSFYERPTNGRL
jgi:hypothetical protein